MELRNVDVQTRANISHNGQVTTRTAITAEGEMKTLGIMHPGVYRQSSEAPETIEITQGRCRVRIHDSDDWVEYQSGQRFEVPGHTHYEIEVSELLDYVAHIH